MASVTISVPDTMKAWIDERANLGPYDDASDYLRQLVRRDREREEKIAAMQRHVTEGFESGLGTMSKEELRQAGREAARKVASGL